MDKIYTCPVTKYTIAYKVIDKDAYLCDIISDYKNIKALLMLINLSIDGLISIGVENVKQYMAFIEWKKIKKNTSFQIICVEDDICLISCIVSDFAINYWKALDSI